MRIHLQCRRHRGDMGSMPGPGRSPGEEHGNPLQYSCLENPMGRGTWRAKVHGVAESDTTEATKFVQIGGDTRTGLIKSAPENI